MSTARRALSRRARVYIWMITPVGVALAVYCLGTIVGNGVTPQTPQMLLFAALAILSGRVTLKVPSVTARFSPSEMFTFTCVLLFGPEVGALTLATDSLLLAWRHKWRLEQTLFNYASLTLSIWIAGTLFFKTAGVAPLAVRALQGNRPLLPPPGL